MTYKWLVKCQHLLGVNYFPQFQYDALMVCETRLAMGVFPDLNLLVTIQANRMFKIECNC